MLWTQLLTILSRSDDRIVCSRRSECQNWVVFRCFIIWYLGSFKRISESPLINERVYSTPAEESCITEALLMRTFQKCKTWKQEAEFKLSLMASAWTLCHQWWDHDGVEANAPASVQMYGSNALIFNLIGVWVQREHGLEKWWLSKEVEDRWGDKWTKMLPDVQLCLRSFDCMI